MEFVPTDFLEQQQNIPEDTEDNTNRNNVNYTDDDSKLIDDDDVDDDDDIDDDDDHDEDDDEDEEEDMDEDEENVENNEDIGDNEIDETVAKSEEEAKPPEGGSNKEKDKT